MKKRLLSVLLTLCMILTLLPVSAFAAYSGGWWGGGSGGDHDHYPDYSKKYDVRIDLAGTTGSGRDTERVVEEGGYVTVTLSGDINKTERVQVDEEGYYNKTLYVNLDNAVEGDDKNIYATVSTESGYTTESFSLSKPYSYYGYGRDYYYGEVESSDWKWDHGGNPSGDNNDRDDYGYATFKVYYLWGQADYPEELHANGDAVDYGPGRNDTPMCRLTINVDELVDALQEKYQSDNVVLDDYNGNGTWAITPATCRITNPDDYDEWWDVVLDYVTDGMQDFKNTGLSNIFVGYVLKEQDQGRGTNYHLDGKLLVQPPVYSVELYLKDEDDPEYRYAGGIVESKDQATYRDVRDTYETLIGHDFPGEDIQFDWNDLTFTVDGKTYKITEDEHTPDGNESVNDNGSISYKTMRQGQSYVAQFYLSYEETTPKTQSGHIHVDVVVNGTPLSGAVGDYVTVNPQASNQDPDPTFDESTDTIEFDYLYYNCADVEFTPVDGYVIEAIDTDVVYGQSGYTPVDIDGTTVTVDNIRGCTKSDISNMADGAAVVTVYLRTAYTVEYYKDNSGTALSGDYKDTNTYVSDLTENPGDGSALPSVSRPTGDVEHGDDAPTEDAQGNQPGSALTWENTALKKQITLKSPLPAPTTSGNDVTGWYEDASGTEPVYTAGESVDVEDHATRADDNNVIKFYARETTPKNPELTVTKTVVSVGGTSVENQDNITAKVGDTIVYQIVVENTGNVDLTGINVTDTLTKGEGQDAITTPLTLYADENCETDATTPISLNKHGENGSSATFYAKYEVKAEDAGTTLSNKATATSGDTTDDGSVDVNVTDQHTLTVEYYYEEVKQGNQFTPEGVTTTSYTLNEGDPWTIAITDADSVEGAPHVARATVTRVVDEKNVNYMFDSAVGQTVTDGLISGTMETQNVVVQLIYTKDSIGTEDPNTPDTVPDKYQVTINYVAGIGGSITGTQTEVKTVLNSSEQPDENGTVTASGSTAVETEGYFFSNWTCDDNSVDTSTLEKQFSNLLLTVTGGDVITFTANFTAETYNLSVVKDLISVGDTTITPGTDIPKAEVKQNIVWTITVTNNGNQPLTNVVVTDTLSAVLNGQTASPSGSIVLTPDPTEGATISGNTVTIASLAPGASVTITATYEVQEGDAGKTLNNAAVADSNETEPTDPQGPEEGVTVKQVGLNVDKSAKTTDGSELTNPVALGTEIVYTIEVENTGNVDLSNVKVTDDKWTSTTQVKQGETSIDLIQDLGTQSWYYTIENLAAGTTVTLTYSYTATQPGELKNTVTATDEDGTTNTDDYTVTVGTAQVAILKELTQVNGAAYTGGAVKVDDVLTYTITVTNNSGVALNNVIVTDVFDGAGSPNFGNNGAVQWDDTTKTATWNVGTVAANTSATLTYTYTVLDADEGNTISNTATLTADEVDDGTPPTSEEEVTVSDRFTLIYDANGGSFGNDEETFTVPNLPADTYTLTETEDYNEPTNGNYVFIGWSENASAVIGAGEEIPGCITEVTLSDENPTQTVYAVWGEDANDDGIADAQQIVIRPADITIYTGGDGYEGVVNGSDGEMTGSSTNHGLPEPGYYLVLPYELNEDLRDDPNATGAVDLSQHLRFTYGADRIWELELYNPNSTSMAYDYYIYQMVPQVAGQDPVRLEIKNGDNYVTSDDFTIALDTLYQEYKMKLYTGEVVSSGITVEINTGTGWTTVSPNEAKGICAIEGDLTVRGTNSNDPVTSIESSVTSPVDVITAEAGDVTYYINDSDIPVVNQDEVALLSDELVGEGVSTLLDEAEDRLGLAWYEDYEYQTQYLDLVDTSNGNAYVTLGAGDSVDIHWPMPNGTSRWNTDFYVVHFDGLDRNFDDLDAQLNSGKVDLEVYTLGDGLRIENGNLVFTTDTFSPFVLIWQDSGRDWPDDDDDDDDNDRPNRDDDDDDDGSDAPELDKESHIAYVSGTPEGTIEPDAYITREEVATIFFRLLTDRSRANYITDYNPFPDVDSSRWSFYPIVTMNNAGIMHGYNDGSFAPSGYITRAEFAVVAAQFSDAEYTGADLFSDISGHWAREYINRAASEGWISGYPDGSFGPDDYITRAQVMALVNEVLDRAPDADHMLDDMITWPDNADKSAWYYEDVQEATNSHSYVWRNSGRTSEEWEELIETRTLNELVRDAFNGVGISY